MRNSIKTPLAASVVTCMTMLTFGPWSQVAQASSPVLLADSATNTARTIGIGPATTDGRLDGRSSFEFVGRAGSTVRDQVGLVNYTDTPVSVTVYSTDGFTSTTGAFDLLPGSGKPRELGKWIGLKPRVVEIPARVTSPIVKPGLVTVPFVLRVPASAKPGDLAAGIVMSLRTKKASGAPTVVVDRRVGTRVTFRVLGATNPSAAITDLAASYQASLNPVSPGSVRLSYAFVNQGNVTLSAQQRVTVQGLVGGPSVLNLEPVGPVLPGDKVIVEAQVPGLWAQGLLNVDVVAIPFLGTNPAGPALPEVTARTTVPAVSLVAVLALLIIIGGASIVLRRGRRLAPAQDHTPELVDA